MFHDRPFQHHATGGSTAPNTIGGLTRQEQLPYELFLHVFSYLKETRDIAMVCRCSRVFHDIAEASLYRIMNLDFVEDHGRSKSAWKALHTIHNHHYAAFVTEMRVELQRCTKFQSSDECSCGPMDLQLGAAIQSMNALEVLSIKCHLCMEPGYGRHQYLVDLPTRKLRELSVDCSCAMGASYDHSRLFEAQHMRSITALNWGTFQSSVIWTKTLQEWMKDVDLLPNIDTIQYYGSGIWDELLATRKIRRLSSPATDPSTVLNRNPNKKLITHLVINGHSLQQCFRDVTVTDQFRNLQHVGTLVSWFGANPTRERILQCLSHVLGLISNLKNLVSMDLHTPYLPVEHDPWDQDRLSQLQTVHPKLRKLFLHNIGIWVLRESTGIWENHTFDRAFAAWDIVTGVYDNI